MRKVQKKQAEDLVKLLSRVHEQIRNAIESDNVAISVSLLEQCQNAAIKVGELIERAEGEGFVTIPILEEYCESVYQIHERIARSEVVNGSEVHRELQAVLTRVGNSIENDIRVRREVVFLPYKASNWSMLQNVWKAADEDPDCDVFVIPIPYYYKNFDGSFREMQYDGDQYPEDVPVTRYDAFDFAGHRPDVIVIQNPYDQYNHTISVHPFFYSANLKNFTENLVYIPYFVVDEIDPDDERAVGSMEYFVAMPGVVNADRVIVQSEKMRQSYIDYLSKAAGEDTRELWEAKIHEWGFHGMDQIQNVREYADIPEEWLEIIQKPDGNRKKIILYYTSISTLFQYREQMFEKMQSVFETFRENQDEVVLLWHPHLLIQETLESMCPELWLEYQKMVAEYKSERWGIFDETADEARVEALCDAYYGDGSSMVRLFMKNRKPVMIQDVELMK